MNRSNGQIEIAFPGELEEQVRSVDQDFRKYRNLAVAGFTGSLLLGTALGFDIDGVHPSNEILSAAIGFSELAAAYVSLAASAGWLGRAVRARQERESLLDTVEYQANPEIYNVGSLGVEH